MYFKSIILLVSAAMLVITGAAAAASDPVAPDWSDRIKFNGDFRLRYESIDEQFEENRDRMRFRARLGLTGQLRDDIKVVLRLATGGGNPISTNQTFGDGFSTKDIGLDLAYVDWQVNEDLVIKAGKIKNPLFRAGGAPLIWDGDLNPEGFAATINSGHFFATVGGFSAEERSSADDSLLYAVQGGVNIELGGAGKMTAGAGYFAYTDTVGNTPFYNGDAKGNSVDPGGNYLFEYRNAEVFVQFDTRVSDQALRLFAQYTQNQKASNEDSAFALGAKIGTVKQKGDTEFSVTYQDIEADSVISAFNGSDFGGGGTDSAGYMVKAKYGVSEKIFLGGTFFINDIDRFQGTEHDYSRLQIDLEFKFD